MRILIIHPRMNVLGGGERVAIHSIITCLKAQHEVYLASEDFDARAFEDFFACQGLFKNVHILTYSTFRPLTGRAVLYQRLLYHQRHLRRILPKAGDFDLVLSTQDVAYVPSVKVPVIQYCYFPEYFVHLDASPSSPFWRMYYWPASQFYHNRVDQVDCLLSTSNFTRHFVKERWKRESTTLYPPCPTDLYKNLKGRREDLVITVGRIVPEKRMDLFLTMAERLPSVKFAIVGSVSDDRESYLRHLRDIAPANVSFVMSPLRKVRDLLATAKVYVHSARSEHFGISIVEGMAAGCVPVVYDGGGPREIVTEEVGYRWKSVDEAAQHISNVIHDEALRAKLSSLSACRAERFRPEAFESDFAKVLARYEN